MTVNTNQEKHRGEIPVSSMSSQETHSAHNAGSHFGGIGNMDIQASQAPVDSRVTMPTMVRQEIVLASELFEALSEIIEGLENLPPLEGRNGVLTRRSPLPLWYPRRPLQDITAILNSAHVASQEAPTVKKKDTKKAQPVELYSHLHDMRGGTLGKQRAPRIPVMRKSSVDPVATRSSMLRKGFR